MKLSEATRRISDLFGSDAKPGSPTEDDFLELLEPLERAGVALLAGTLEVHSPSESSSTMGA